MTDKDHAKAVREALAKLAVALTAARAAGLKFEYNPEFKFSTCYKECEPYFAAPSFSISREY